MLSTMNVVHGRITSQYFEILYVVMTPHGIYSIKIFVSLWQDFEQKLANFMTPQGSYSIQIFVSLGACFELDFESISVKNRSI